MNNPVNRCSISLVIMEIRIYFPSICFAKYKHLLYEVFHQIYTHIMSRHKKTDSLNHCQTEYKLLWPLQQQLHNTFKIKMCISYDLAILLLSVYPGEIMRHLHEETSARIFISAFIAK